ncbi:zinc transporter [Actinomyces oris]|uniref:Zinc transporter n=1 Tax=Actinomyces oris TaxID=544580 RepID=A0AAW8L9D7_9ACTO|nr:zinc transporter [Actinomyces oris]MDR0178324.1 zinc transporter [Actinomyces oris]
MTASDPSMWEEQSHRECSPEKDEYGLDKFKCNLATLHRPTQPDQPTGTDPRTITVTTRQAATLIASGSGITRQPPGPKVIISMAFIVYTNPAPRYQTTTILGTPIEVEFTPASYTWGWGDGTTTTTTDPGAPYPNQTVTHHYQHTATGVTTTLTTTWTTRYRPQEDPTWRPIEGTITTTETSPSYDLVRVVTYLTDDAEEAQGH